MRIRRNRKRWLCELDPSRRLVALKGVRARVTGAGKASLPIARESFTAHLGSIDGIVGTSFTRRSDARPVSHPR